MVRFIHTADWQIGMQAAHTEQAAERVQEARLEAARRVVELAQEHDVDFLVLAGDTFEHNAVDRVTVQKVADILERFSKPSFILPGNHDPLVPGSVWVSPAWASCRHVHVLKDTEPVKLPNVWLFPCPVKEKHSTADPTRHIHAQDCPVVAVGVAHGTVEGIEAENLELPIAAEAAEAAGLDYLALGHWHSKTLFRDKSARVRMAYSGTHEQTRFGERDSGNVLLVEIPERNAEVQVTTLHTGVLTWEFLKEELNSLGQLTRLRETIEAYQQPERTLLIVQLQGLLFAQEASELARIEQLLEARFLFGRLDKTQLIPSPEDNDWIDGMPPGPLRGVAEQLKEMAGSSESDTWKKLEQKGMAPQDPGARKELAMQALLELYRLVRTAD